jgi:hypothetical protein
MVMGQHRLCGEGEEEETGVREGEGEEGEGERGGAVGTENRANGLCHVTDYAVTHVL